MTWKVGDKSRSELQITKDIDFRVTKVQVSRLYIEFRLSLELDLT